MALAPGCVVAFDDYPLGAVPREQVVGGQGSTAGSSSATGGTGNEGAVSGSLNGGTTASGGTEPGGTSTGAAGNGGSSSLGGGGSGANGGSGGSNSPAGDTGDAGAPMAGMAGEPGSFNPGPFVVEITSVDDTYVSSSSPGSNYGNEVTLIVDRNYSGGGGPGGHGGGVNMHNVLIRALLDALPGDALVSAAKLTLHCSRVGDAVTVSYIEGTWQEAAVNYDNKPATGSGLGMFTPIAQDGTLVIDLQAAVTAWLAGDHTNYGVYLSIVDGMNATECASSEAADASKRPRLSVTYTLP